MIKLFKSCFRRIFSVHDILLNKLADYKKVHSYDHNFVDEFPTITHGSVLMWVHPHIHAHIWSVCKSTDTVYFHTHIYMDHEKSLE